MPSFLHNRLEHFARHCLKRLTSDLTSTDIQFSASGVYKVSSDSDSAITNTVDFSGSVPSCGCTDWKLHCLPCKHMLAWLQSFLVAIGWIGILCQVTIITLLCSLLTVTCLLMLFHLPAKIQIIIQSRFLLFLCNHRDIYLIQGIQS